MPLMMLIPVALLVALVGLGVHLWKRTSAPTHSEDGTHDGSGGQSADFWGGVAAGAAGVLVAAVLLAAVAGVTAMALGGMDGMMRDSPGGMDHGGDHGDHEHGDTTSNDTSEAAVAEADHAMDPMLSPDTDPARAPTHGHGLGP